MVLRAIRIFITVGVILGQTATTLPQSEPPADYVLVKKSARMLYLLREGKTIRRYTIALGDNPTGHKRTRGDERTPEGIYIIDWRNPKSKYYKSLHISYPNRADRENADKNGVDPGGAIVIHGIPEGWEPWDYLGIDWTDGCIGLENHLMDELWSLVPDGTPIEIRP